MLEHTNYYSLSAIWRQENLYFTNFKSFVWSTYLVCSSGLQRL